MGKSLYIAEKPSVAQEFAKALKLKTTRGDGYLETDDCIVTWCVGHLVTMSYPEVYDEKYKRWSLAALPFLPDKFLYEVIPSAAKQYKTVARLLNRRDVDTIYVCTDSGREGEYIYRLVEQMAGVKGKKRLRVWIDSQTEEEILRGIREAKDLSAYDNLAASAYLRAKEDYLMGINFSRLLTLRYGDGIARFLGKKYFVISAGRVMTCVLGMVVKREREIRDFTETPFYRVLSHFGEGETCLEGEWKVSDDSVFKDSPWLYKENGFKDAEHAEELIAYLKEKQPITCLVDSVQKKKEKKYAPLLYNLAELQNECSRQFKISPDETLRIAQELYEKKLVTYPRTDARVLSAAVAKEIKKNLNGLMHYAPVNGYLQEIAAMGSYKNIAGTRYVDDKQITDHYAIIPTGQGFGSLNSLNPLAGKVYDLITRRFLSIFYPPAVYEKASLVTDIRGEKFYTSCKVLKEEGYLKVVGGQDTGKDAGMLAAIEKLKKGMELPVQELLIREGKTTPPKRYSSGSLILAMENAGQLIEDEELRAQIKGSGIGTSATRGEILKKLFTNKYLSLNKKTQIVTPTLEGEMIYDVTDHSIRSLLNPELTASWEKGLSYVAEGKITNEEYMMKLTDYIRRRHENVMQLDNQSHMQKCYADAAIHYKRRGKNKR